jgi:hypothetical protein
MHQIKYSLALARSRPFGPATFAILTRFSGLALKHDFTPASLAWQASFSQTLYCPVWFSRGYPELPASTRDLVVWKVP